MTPPCRHSAPVRAGTVGRLGRGHPLPGLLKMGGPQEVHEDFSDMVDAALANKVAASDFRVPWHGIAASAVDESVPLPTIVPRQSGPLPKWRDVYCNPELFPGGCTTLGSYGRAIGIPMRAKYQNSYVGRSQEHVGDTVNVAEEKVTAGITPTFVDYIEHEPQVQKAEQLAFALSPLITLQKNDPLYLAAKNATATYVWQPIEHVDKPDMEKQLQQLMRDKAKDAAICRAFNGRAPHCAAEPLDLPTLPPIPTDGPVVPGGYYKYVFVWGFTVQCLLQGGCIAGTPALEPRNFDGFYEFSGTMNGYPFYEKEVSFKDFGSVQKLFLWQGVDYYANPNTFPNAGSWAAITPNSPNFQSVERGSRPPFAIIEGTSMVEECYDPVEFPPCTSQSTRWRLARLTASGCNGVVYPNACLFPTIPEVFPSDPSSL
eukprot:Polyplicarium_translucidae@DN821_c0_g1_i1.p1